MLVEDFIEKAIAGGWEPVVDMETVKDWGHIPNSGSGIWAYERDGTGAFLVTSQILLTPAAWQAVGKVEGWKAACGHCYAHNVINCRNEDSCEDAPLIDRWCAEMHRMIDALAEGKTVEEYLQTLGE